MDSNLADEDDAVSDVLEPNVCAVSAPRLLLRDKGGSFEDDVTGDENASE